MTDINAAHQLYQQLSSDCKEAKRNLDQERASRVRAAEAAIDEELSADRERVLELSRAMYAAKVAYEDALTIQGASSLSAFPSGVVVEWHRPGRSWECRGWEMTGKRGRYEVWSRQSKYPDNAGGYSLPTPGSVYIRELKKSGEPSLRFQKLRSYSTWLPEGEKPKEAP